MISNNLTFEFRDRNRSETLVLLPGWATDCRIFDRLDLDCNTAVPLRWPLNDLESSLLEWLDANGISRVSILGWSLGGFLAADFAGRNPARINRLILIGMRKSYPAGQIAFVRGMLKRNPRAYLSRFYADCFSPQEREQYRAFKESLRDEYLSRFSLEDLVSSLDLLAVCELNPAGLSSLPNVCFIHGIRDGIAPVDEMRSLQSELPRIPFIFLEGAGHALFLAPGFAQQLRSLSL